ncbi:MULTISPECIES: GNAT family N-acetyltransferase [Streptomyces]|uniref:GNAT family N-acetyltransferase n=1 Tax=Streptomyces rochei TaxID=1928 RepID=A0AAX3ZI81_STRRO|nr:MULTISPECIES: GNAT family N-acetyltransferase [Streptomyces]PVD06206.1 GNAT family N-acetyltransferase [Streptomyces sp. CS207]WMC86982.1 GNAT family N-acetyltransferase [Streptomyces rochei]
MPELRRLRADHIPALLAFERENRAWFAARVPDRGDDYFAHFEERIHALLAEQEAGVCHFHVLVGTGGEVLGRVNLVDVEQGVADLGYRIAERAAGQGLATRAVREVCALAARAYGLTALRAAATVDNAASRAVLTRTGFVRTGETLLDGRAGLTFRRDLGDLRDPADPHRPEERGPAPYGPTVPTP